MNNINPNNQSASEAFATVGDAIGSSVEELVSDKNASDAPPASNRRPASSSPGESEAPPPDQGDLGANHDFRYKEYQASTAYRITEDVLSTAEAPVSRLSRWFESKAQGWGKVRLERLVARRGVVSKSMRNIPEQVRRTARQSELVLELVDDFRSGKYRDIPWRSVALMVGVLLYTISPADVIPDTLPVVGGLDDVSIIALATRLLRKDLAQYCEFKGYDWEDYFGTSK